MRKPDIKAAEKADKLLKQIRQERRIKTVFLREDLLINWFATGLEKPTSGFISVVEGIPKHTFVMGVEFNMQYGAFMFLLGSMEFEPVPEGQYAPALNIIIKQFDNEKSNDSV